MTKKLPALLIDSPCDILSFRPGSCFLMLLRSGNGAQGMVHRISEVEASHVRILAGGTDLTTTSRNNAPRWHGTCLQNKARRTAYDSTRRSTLDACVRRCPCRSQDPSYSAAVHSWCVRVRPTSVIAQKNRTCSKRSLQLC